MLHSKDHQYTRSSGHPPLVRILSERYSSHLDREVDGMREIAITVGASQALYLAFTTFLSPNDEVVMFEPYFDLYRKQVALTKAQIRFVQLGRKDGVPTSNWEFDINELRR